MVTSAEGELVVDVEAALLAVAVLKCVMPRAAARRWIAFSSRQWISQSGLASAIGSAARVITWENGDSGVAHVMSSFSYHAAAGST